MKHTVEFTINVDDRTIQKRIEDIAYSDIVDKLIGEASAYFAKECYAYINDRVNWRNIVEELIELHKDEIVDSVSDKLAEAFKEKTSEDICPYCQKRMDALTAHNGTLTTVAYRCLDCGLVVYV